MVKEMGMPRKDKPRALTNFQPDPALALLYEKAAWDTGFPVWVERFARPPQNDEDDLWIDLFGVRFGIRRVAYDYEAAQRSGLWSLWTEWSGRDHSAYWARVKELKEQQ